jgi:uncharacterized protein (TIGR02246 family)
MLEYSPAEVVELLDQAFNRGDIEAVLDFYEEGAIMVVEPGRLATGKAELRSAFEWILTNIKGTAKQEKSHVIEAGDIALFTSKWSYSGETADGTPITRESHATTIFRKGKDGRWRIVVDNSWGPAVIE